MSSKAIKIWVLSCIGIIIVSVITIVIIFLNYKAPYKQNANPDYVSFAYAYVNAIGAPTSTVPFVTPLSSKLGDMICDQLRHGVSERTMTDRLVGTGEGEYVLDRVRAASIVNSAHEYICSGK